MKPATASDENGAFSAQKSIFEFALRARKITIIGALATQFHEISGLEAKKVLPKLTLLLLTSVETCMRNSPLTSCSKLDKQGCSMSLASELLHSTGNKRGANGSRALTDEPLLRLGVLNHTVYSLIAEHEPAPEQSVERLRADQRIMRLSGLVDGYQRNSSAHTYQEAAAVLAELAQALPR